MEKQIIQRSYIDRDSSVPLRSTQNDIFTGRGAENCHLDRSGEVSTVINDIANIYAGMFKSL